ncbi:biotin transporter BioY [Actinomyces sp. oral taxon 170]|uniref:biotin transporter BioY n=1 Tax=Actinomyces sp. oral taxon 170 TaxID=712117 RepID=UPI000205BCD7|nr:biotin transporter BioY [Actinomyces sp. oral taxon 170]EGF57719.1 Tat pathway signal sequence domain protein [Actinomyces sp. oral taxon 170 str. F0386]
MTTNSSTSATGSTADALSADGAVSPALARVREAGLVLAGTVALILIGQITIPLPFTPVPISMGTFAALGVGAVLGSRRGALSALLLGALAAVGAPVLGGWTGGVGVTFGYVVGYILIATIAGRAASVWSNHSGSTVSRVATGIGLMLLASASVYVPGVVWLKIATGANWGATLSMGLVPFIIGDVLKSLVATGLLPVRGRLH